MITFCKMTLDVTRNYGNAWGVHKLCCVTRQKPHYVELRQNPPPPLFLYSFLLGMLGVCIHLGMCINNSSDGSRGAE